MTLTELVGNLARRAKDASRVLARLDTESKNRSLLAMAAALETQALRLREANAKDLALAEAAGLPPAMLDRLRLDQKRIEGMARGLREVAALPDPVGRILDERVRPNGLCLRKVATPIGVIVIIFESRPNVTADAASLCLKSGNATILRGGKEAAESNRVIAEVMVQAARQAEPTFPLDAIQVVPTTDREAIRELLAQTAYVDLCIPRGGEGLIRAVTECSRVPVIKHYKGVCHVFVDREADIDMAVSIVENAKVQRPAVCNAMETLLVDGPVAEQVLPRIAERLAKSRVEWRADAAAWRILEPLQARLNAPLKPVTESDYATEYNDYVLNVAVVDGVEAAVAHINRYGSAHSDSIVTANAQRAGVFLEGIDSAAVYWNASTRFTDGGEFGMGAEIGISTDKIGARGPMGLEELTSYKWIGIGTGQIRA